MFGPGAVKSFSDDEDVDHFILPETPPTIERIKNPPLDQPFLKKQNFVDEFDISPAPVLVGLNFPRFTSSVNPVEVGLYNGSFASRGGSMVYSSSSSADISYSASSTDGEYQNLAQQKNIFSCGYGRDIAPDKYFYLYLKDTDNILSDERKGYYGFSSGCDWYTRENMNLKLVLSYAKGEIKGLGADESVSASLKAQWQPFESQNLNMTAASSKDTGLGAGGVFNDTLLTYDAMLFSRIVIGGGYHFTGSKAFAQGYITAGLAPGTKISVNYAPEIEKADWGRLYINDDHVQLNNNILYPESLYSYTEKLSYYSGEKNSVEFEVSQALWKNYVLWESVPGANLIAPANSGSEVYVSGARLKAGLGSCNPSFSLSAEKNLNYSLTFIPEYRFSAGIEAVTKIAVFGAAYSYTGQMYYQAGSQKQLDAYDNVSVSVKKAVSGSVEIRAWCDNIFSKKLETQPGFVEDAPVFYAGIDLKL